MRAAGDSFDDLWQLLEADREALDDGRKLEHDEVRC
jgi:hypothetical protein